ncbi:MAG: hypothetical protein MPJ22_11845, partial [Pirellulales bacterium]|nr:hypothetical protein [Pirellulales bacterium]
TPRLFRSTVSDTTVPSSMWTWGWSTTPSRTIQLQVGRLCLFPVIRMVDCGRLLYNRVSCQSGSPHWSLAVACYILLFKMLVACLVATVIETYRLSVVARGRLWSIVVACYILLFKILVACLVD